MLHEKSISATFLQLFFHLLQLLGMLQWTESTAAWAEQSISPSPTARRQQCGLRTDLMPTSTWAFPLLTPVSTEGDTVTSIQTRGLISECLPLLVRLCRQLSSSSRTIIQTPLLLLTAERANNKYLHGVLYLAPIKPAQKWSAISSIYHCTAPGDSSALPMQLRIKPFVTAQTFISCSHQVGIAAFSHNKISDRIFTGSSETCLLYIQENLIYSNQQ